MTERTRRLLVTSGILLALWGTTSGCRPADADGDSVTIRGSEVSVEIVRTAEEQALGLGNRDALAWGHGMLFPYARPGFYSFWMYRMRFDIDIVWIRGGRIVGIAHRVPHPPTPDAEPARVRPPELVDLVLEVPAGFAQANGWRRGDRVDMVSSGPARSAAAAPGPS